MLIYLFDILVSGRLPAWACRSDHTGLQQLHDKRGGILRGGILIHIIFIQDQLYQVMEIFQINSPVPVKVTIPLNSWAVSPEGTNTISPAMFRLINSFVLFIAGKNGK